MGPFEAIKNGLQNLFNFQNRASRKEYWWKMAATTATTFALQSAMIYAVGPLHGFTIRTGELISPQIALMAAKFAVVFNAPMALFCLIMLPVTARRFKDHGWRGGWFKWAWYVNFLSLAFAIAAAIVLFSNNSSHFAKWLFAPSAFMFIPFASVIWCFWIGFVRPEPNNNQYGPNPAEVPS